MAQTVALPRLLELLDEVGLPADAEGLVAHPKEWWDGVPPEKQATILTRLGIDPGKAGIQEVRAIVPEDGAIGATQIEIVVAGSRRRKKRGPFAGARDELRTEPIVVQKVAGDLSLFTDESAITYKEGLIGLLDRAWGGEPYDVAAEGAFFRNEEVPGWTVLDRYVVEDSFASVALAQRNDTNELVYRIEEPPLTPEEEALIASLNDRLRDVLIVEDEEIEDRAFHLARKVFGLLRLYRVYIDRRTAYKVAYYFVRNYLGYGRIDALMRDTGIEDISCNGPELPLYVVHTRHQNVATDITFDEMELNSLTIKLAQRGGKLLSIAQPMVDATLPDGSRIQASLGREVTSRGSAFTIRKFRADPLTAVDLIRGGTHTPDTMAFLWLMVENKRSLVVMGATASGKTTTLNCLSQFIPPTLKVVSIEDTREITLKHENWLAAVTRDSFSGAASEKITMYDLLRAALRQRPEYIIVGEIRGVEGLTLFQAMSTGHTCFSTMHAGSVENAVYRLENPPISVPRVMLTSLDFLLLQGQVDVAGRPVRRMLALSEVGGIDSATRNLRFNEVYRWDPAGDTIEAPTSSLVLESVREKRGWTRSTLDEEIAARRRVLETLVEKKQRNYVEVAKAVRDFYANRGFTAPEPKPSVEVGPS